MWVPSPEFLSNFNIQFVKVQYYSSPFVQLQYAQNTKSRVKIASKNCCTAYLRLSKEACQGYCCRKLLSVKAFFSTIDLCFISQLKLLYLQFLFFKIFDIRKSCAFLNALCMKMIMTKCCKNFGTKMRFILIFFLKKSCCISETSGILLCKMKSAPRNSSRICFHE